MLYLNKINILIYFNDVYCAAFCFTAVYIDDILLIIYTIYKKKTPCLNLKILVITLLFFKNNIRFSFKNANHLIIIIIIINHLLSKLEI